MKVALAHDYLKEYGGAERVLSALHEMYPEAPIYTAFYTRNGTVAKEFKDADIRTSWANFILKYKNLHSPFRFLIPLIWESFDFSKYDVVILSSSGYITKPIKVPKNVRVISYCHTPPRFLWGYQTSAEWAKYSFFKIGSEILAHFLRLYDFKGAQRVDQFVANSENVKKRIWKDYRKESVVIYPPVNVLEISKKAKEYKEKGDYFLVVSRIVGGKGIPMVMEAANKLGVRLVIAGNNAGLQWENKRIEEQKKENIEFVGEVSEEEKIGLMASAKAFIASEKDVDFGITPVEAMAAGTPVVAFKAGGFLESVIDGKTGTFFEEYNAESLAKAMKKISKMKFKKEDLLKQANKFSKHAFISKMKEVVNA